MTKTKLLIIIFVSNLFLIQCTSKNKKGESIITKTDTISTPKVKNLIKNPKYNLEEKEDETNSENNSIFLNDNNAIPFFFKYGKINLEDKVRISTRFGNIDIKLFKNTPYHRANFIYLTKRGYFNKTTFHRVVRDFIIQGGNSDRYETSQKREKIGKYLLPPDTRKGYKHHRGVISVPSSEIENPHKLASPYEFFIVQQSPGAYHLDGSYTIFGKVIAGMEVVDKINRQRTDKRDTPLTNVFMEVSILE